MEALDALFVAHMQGIAAAHAAPARPPSTPGVGASRPPADALADQPAPAALPRRFPKHRHFLPFSADVDGDDGDGGGGGYAAGDGVDEWSLSGTDWSEDPLPAQPPPPSQPSFLPKINPVEEKLAGLAARDISHILDGRAAQVHVQTLEYAGPTLPPPTPPAPSTDPAFVPWSRIPAQYHAYIRSPLRQAFPKDAPEVTFDQQARLWQSVLFPSAKPTSRTEVLYLLRTLEAMLAAHDDDHATRLDFVDVARLATEEDPTLEDLCKVNFRVNFFDELQIWDVVFAEVVRQVYTHCAERGILLEKVRARFVTAFAQCALLVRHMQQALARFDSYDAEMEELERLRQEHGVHKENQELQNLRDELTGAQDKIFALEDQVQTLQQELEAAKRESAAKSATAEPVGNPEERKFQDLKRQIAEINALHSSSLGTGDDSAAPGKSSAPSRLTVTRDRAVQSTVAQMDMGVGTSTALTYDVELQTEMDASDIDEMLVIVQSANEAAQTSGSAAKLPSFRVPSPYGTGIGGTGESQVPAGHGTIDQLGMSLRSMGSTTGLFQWQWTSETSVRMPTTRKQFFLSNLNRMSSSQELLFRPDGLESPSGSRSPSPSEHSASAGSFKSQQPHRPRRTRSTYRRRRVAQATAEADIKAQLQEARDEMSSTLQSAASAKVSVTDLATLPQPNTPVVERRPSRIGAEVASLRDNLEDLKAQSAKKRDESLLRKASKASSALPDDWREQVQDMLKSQDLDPVTEHSEPDGPPSEVSSRATTQQGRRDDEMVAEAKGAFKELTEFLTDVTVQQEATAAAADGGGFEPVAVDQAEPLPAQDPVAGGAEGAAPGGASDADADVDADAGAVAEPDRDLEAEAAAVSQEDAPAAETANVTKDKARRQESDADLWSGSPVPVLERNQEHAPRDPPPLVRGLSKIMNQPTDFHVEARDPAAPLAPLPDDAADGAAEQQQAGEQQEGVEPASSTASSAAEPASSSSRGEEATAVDLQNGQAVAPSGDQEGTPSLLMSPAIQISRAESATDLPAAERLARDLAQDVTELDLYEGSQIAPGSVAAGLEGAAGSEGRVVGVVEAGAAGPVPATEVGQLPSTGGGGGGVDVGVDVDATGGAGQAEAGVDAPTGTAKSAGTDSASAQSNVLAASTKMVADTGTGPMVASSADTGKLPLSKDDSYMQLRVINGQVVSVRSKGQTPEQVAAAAVQHPQSQQQQQRQMHHHGPGLDLEQQQQQLQQQQQHPVQQRAPSHPPQPHPPRSAPPMSRPAIAAGPRATKSAHAVRIREGADEELEEWMHPGQRVLPRTSPLEEGVGAEVEMADAGGYYGEEWQAPAGAQQANEGVQARAQTRTAATTATAKSLKSHRSAKSQAVSYFTVDTEFLQSLDSEDPAERRRRTRLMTRPPTQDAAMSEAWRDILRRHKSEVEVKSRVWVLGRMRELYKEKIASDLAAERDQIPRLRMPEFVVRHYKEKYGTQGLVDKYIATVLKGVDHYRSSDLGIEIFARFLDETWHLDVLSLFLRTMVALDESAVGLSFPAPPAESGQIRWVDFARCQAVAALVFGQRPPDMDQRFLERVYQRSLPASDHDLRNTAMQHRRKATSAGPHRKVPRDEFLALVCQEDARFKNSFHMYLQDLFSRGDHDLHGRMTARQLEQLMASELGEPVAGDRVKQLANTAKALSETFDRTGFVRMGMFSTGLFKARFRGTAVYDDEEVGAFVEDDGVGGGEVEIEV